MADFKGKTKNFVDEFKGFALKGNVVDMAVGVIIGTAFGKIVSSFVGDVMMPFFGLLVGSVDFTGLSVILREPITDEAGELIKDGIVLNYGQFLQVSFDFVIVALVIFVVLKKLFAFKKNEEILPAAPVAPTELEVLTEIRDLLKEKTTVPPINQP